MLVVTIAVTRIIKYKTYINQWACIPRRVFNMCVPVNKYNMTRILRQAPIRHRFIITRFVST